jgi:hypothetical protein
MDDLAHWQKEVAEMKSEHDKKRVYYTRLDAISSIVYIVLSTATPSAYILDKSNYNFSSVYTWNMILLGVHAALIKRFNFDGLKQKHRDLSNRCGSLLDQMEFEEEQGKGKEFVKFVLPIIDEIRKSA